jgi:hypothetical protein
LGYRCKGAEVEIVHRQAKDICWDRGHANVDVRVCGEAVAEEDLRARAGGDSTAHVLGEESEANLVGGVHPSEAFTRYHLEVDALVAVLGVYEMRQLDSVELRESQSLFRQENTYMYTFSGTTPLKSTNAVVIM